MATVMSHPPPSRKPVPGRTLPGNPSFTLQTPQYTQERLHSRSRTNSSALLPYGTDLPSQTSISPAYTMTLQQPPSSSQQQPYSAQSRRTLSNATSSTSSTNTNHAAMSRVPTTNSAASTTGGVRRSTSSRSNSSISPTSYVALMRKQKGTVWCDRAQHEDPRILAAQRQAKMRAAAEVAGGHNYAAQSRSSQSSSGVVGGVRSKIRYHGAPKASAYNAALMAGAGLPMRLSATEVDDGNDSDEESSAKYHVRNGSARSSVRSGQRAQSYRASSLNQNFSNGNTPPGISPVDGMSNVTEEATPMPKGNGAERDDYFTQTGGSGSSGEQEESFGQVGGLPHTKGVLSAEEQAKKSTIDDLRRRGSVDERTMTMSGPRLFVANPDLSD